MENFCAKRDLLHTHALGVLTPVAECRADGMKEGFSQEAYLGGSYSSQGK